MQPSDDYQALPPSPRHLVAEDVALAIQRMGLNQPVGGVRERDTDDRYHAVKFSFPRRVDGEIRVWSPGYISVFWRTVIPGMPGQDRRIYASLEEAVSFVELAFVEMNADEALAIPVYVHKRQPKPATSAGQAPQDDVAGIKNFTLRSARPSAARAPRSSLSPLVTVFLSPYLSKALRLPSAGLWKLFSPDASSTSCRKG